LVLEVNSSPGIQSLEKTLERNISQEIIAFCESEMGITN